MTGRPLDGRVAVVTGAARGLAHDGAAVALLDLSHAGGISEVRRIASLAEVHDAVLAPHCPLGPIALAAGLQVALATPNVLIQEQSAGIHYHDGADLLDSVVDRTQFAFHDGVIHRWDEPGPGIEVRRADTVGHRWRPPLWRHADGSFAEW